MLQFDVEPRAKSECPIGEKPGYSSVKDANTAILRSWNARGADSPKTLHPYTCPRCGYIHLSSCEPRDNDVKTPAIRSEA